MRLRRSLTTLPLVFVMFFNVSGGAFTLEGLVAELGPGLALATLAIVPLVWSLPTALAMFSVPAQTPLGRRAIHGLAVAMLRIIGMRRQLP